MNLKLGPSYDITIICAGLAGLTLARHLLLYTDKTVLLLDKRVDPPGPTQRVGESLVHQVGLTPAEAMEALERQFNSLKAFARWIVAQVHAIVLGDPEIGMDTEYIAATKLRDFRFDPEEIRSAKKMEMELA